MKPLAVVLVGGLVVGGGLFFDTWQDPRTAGPAPIPERYLELARGECVEGLSRGAEAVVGAEAFCGCVTREVGGRFSFRAFRVARVELEKARAEASDPDLPGLLRAHKTLGPIIQACSAEHLAGTF